MLGGAGPLDKDLIRAWMDFDWKAQLPGPDKDDVRNELTAHLNALLEAQLQPIGLDGSVIDTARRALLQSPLASRAYNTMKQSAAARKLPEWRIAANAGPAADRVFVRTSPLKLLLISAAKETQLSRAPDIGGALGDKAAAAVQGATAAASGAANKLAGIVGQSAVPAIPSYGQAVDDHFRRLHEFVGLGGQGPAPIDDLIRGLNQGYLQPHRMGQPGQGPGAPAD